MKYPNLAALVLAAGSSSRLGQPKQLLPFRGTTLLEYAIKCVQSATSEVYVVLGANAPLIQSNTNLNGAQVLVNEQWNSGMGSSIAIGMQHLLKQATAHTHVLISVCDQPYLTSNHLLSLCDQHYHTQNDITASYYSDCAGVPAVFSQRLFSDLADLKGDKGAGSIIASGKYTVGQVSFSQGEIDIDTPDDWNKIAASQVK